MKRSFGRAAGPWCALVFAASVAFAGGCLARGNPCRSDADCPGGTRCEDAYCAGASKPVPPVLSCPDALEPNNRLAEARLLPAGETAGLRLCAGDDDWYAIELRENETLDVYARFGATVTAPRVALAIHGPSGELLAMAPLVRGAAGIGSLRAGVTGRHHVRVYVAGADDAASAEQVWPYELSIRVGRADCDRRASLPVERVFGEVRALPAPVAPLALTAFAERFFEVPVRAAETVRAVASRASGSGQVELAYFSLAEDRGVYAPVRAPLQRTTSGAALRYGPASRDELLVLRVVSDADVRATLAVTRDRATHRRTGVVEGAARFEDREVMVEGLGPPVDAPLPHALVELVRDEDEYVLGAGTTGADGRFRVPFENYGAEAAHVRVVASRGGFVGCEVLRDETCREVYAVSAPLTVDAPALALDAPAQPVTSRVELVASADDVGGAFNIFEVFNRAIALIERTGHPPRARTMVAFWERGVKYPCGSCQLGGAVYVGGGAADPDEYDDPVLAHEAAHVYEELWSRSDNPGGAHNGTRADPTLAWSEGFATFFSSLVRGSNLYVDTRDGESLVQDLERYASRSSVGTSNMALDGEVSEFLVSAVLWDLHDAASTTEPFDVASHPELDMLLPGASYLPSAQWRDRGVSGVDFVDWLDGWRCLGVGPDAELRPLLEARSYPYDFPQLPPCQRAPAEKPGAPIELALDARPQGPDGRVSVRAVGHALEDADALRLTLRLPKGWQLVSTESTTTVTPVAATASDPRERYDLRRPSVLRGDELVATFVVIPSGAPRAALSVAAALEGASAERAAVVRGWPNGVRRVSARGRTARSGSGRRLIVFPARLAGHQRRR